MNFDSEESDMDLLWQRIVRTAAAAGTLVALTAGSALLLL
jgi:hypothetical protein